MPHPNGVIPNGIRHLISSWLYAMGAIAEMKGVIIKKPVLFKYQDPGSCLHSNPPTCPQHLLPLSFAWTKLPQAWILLWIRCKYCQMQSGCLAWKPLATQLNRCWMLFGWRFSINSVLWFPICHVRSLNKARLNVLSCWSRHMSCSMQLWDFILSQVHIEICHRPCCIISGNS
jgi:hypothetical protein